MDTYLPKTFEQACRVPPGVQAMNHMHEKGFVHADFKPNNRVVDNDLHAKIIDWSVVSDRDDQEPHPWDA